MKFHRQALVGIALVTLAASAGAEDWTARLSPRMRKAFQPMTSPDWSPRKEVELTAAERSDLQKLFPRVAEQARELLKSATLAPPKKDQPRPLRPTPPGE